MATSTIDHDEATVTRTVTIAAPRDLVWALLTAPDQLSQWFGQRADFPDGVAPGALGSFGWTGEGDFPARIEINDPQTRFAFTWGSPGEPLREDNATTATFTLADAADGGTELTVVETGFDRLSGDAAAHRRAMEDNAQGWNAEIDELVARAETLPTGTDPAADLDARRITHTVLVRSGAPIVWDALTDPTAIEQWWGHPAVFPDGFVAGADGTFEWVGHGLFPMHVQTCEPQTRLVLLWGALDVDRVDERASHVLFSLTPVGADRTLVTVVETFGELDRADLESAMTDNVPGWRLVLDGLATHAARVSG